MSEPLSVNPEQISGSSAAFHAVSDTANEINSQLANGVDNAGDWYGDDSFGRNLRDAVQVPIDGLKNALTNIGLFASTTGDNLTSTAVAYQNADNSISDDVPGPITDNAPHPTTRK
jgi:Excreted virulence factor EspC, type VII ESX diderm